MKLLAFASMAMAALLSLVSAQEEFAHGVSLLLIVQSRNTLSFCFSSDEYHSRNAVSTSSAIWS
jgi:hypothetical protein